MRDKLMVDCVLLLYNTECNLWNKHFLERLQINTKKGKNSDVQKMVICHLLIIHITKKKIVKRAIKKIKRTHVTYLTKTIYWLS